MKVYSVYRVHYRTSKIDFIGKVVERRMEERDSNFNDLKRYAEQLYGKSSDSKIVISSGSAPPWHSFGDA
jgi:hypothetical protein